jgi:molecular chaperone GrpE
MSNQQDLFEKFLNFLQTEPELPEYLGEEPESGPSFDPYQMVAEWIALRHEVKQQGKLLQSTQNTLQQAFDTLKSEKADLQQQLETSRKQGLAEVSQKSLWRDLLGVMDALDQAIAHWQEQIDSLAQPTQPQSFWRRLLQPERSASGAETSASVREILVSNQQGIDLIRRSLLDVLRQQQVTPIEALGKPFNSQTMYAIGRQESTSVPENTIIQEVVRGYLWREQVLREAQVIVAVRKGVRGEG